MLNQTKQFRQPFKPCDHEDLFLALTWMQKVGIRASLFIYLMTTLALFSQAPSDPANVPAATTAISRHAPSEQECVELAQQIEKAIATNKPAFFVEVLDIDEVIARGLAGLNPPKDLDTDFRKAFQKSPEVGELTKQFTRAKYTFLRVRTFDGTPRALFRLLRPDGSLNYQELLMQQSSNAVKVVDIQFLTDGKQAFWETGDLFSDVARRSFLPRLAIIRKGFFARLMGEQSEAIKHLGDTTEFVKRIKQKHFPNAMAVYAALPPTLQNQKDILVQRALGALVAGEQEFQAALAVWNERFPNDLALDLAILDHAVKKKDHATAIETIDRLDHGIGGDGYLSYLKAVQYEFLADWEKTTEAARNAISRDTQLPQAYSILLNSLLHAEEFFEAGQVLINLHMNFQEDGTGNLSKHQKYARFTQSEGFKQWQQYRKPTPPPTTAAVAKTSGGRPSPGRNPPPNVKGAKPTLKLQGITVRQDKSSALINGTTVFVGEEIDLYTIVKIEPDKVILQSRNGEEKVLALKTVYSR